MPKFFKLFRGKKGKGPSTPEEKRSKKDKKTPRKSKSALKDASSSSQTNGHPVSTPTKVIDAAPDIDDNGLRRTPSFTATTHTRDSSVSREHPETQPSSQQQPQRAVISSVPKEVKHNGGPVDLDASDFEESDLDESGRLQRNASTTAEPRLSFQQLQQFNLQHNPPPTSTNGNHPLYAPNPTTTTTPPKTYYMAEPPHNAAGGVPNLMDETANHSEASSSSFNLSTDAEDHEYNNLKHSAQAPDGLSSPNTTTNYTTDEDRAIFPALQDDDDDDEEHVPKPHSTHPTPDDEPGQIKSPNQIKIVPMPTETAEDLRAWGAGFDFNATANQFPTTPKDVNDAFGSDPFAGFDPFPSQPPKASPRPLASSRKDSHHPPSSPSRRHHASSSASLAQAPESSLSDLLAQAKQKSRRGSSRHMSSSSVNSAPVVTSSYLRQHHKLGRMGDRESSLGGSSKNAASVSDIISSLEATNASRLKNKSSRSVQGRSSTARSRHGGDDAASNGGTSTRSAKERLRERRRRSSGRRQGGSDESEEGAEASESWLFDEVAGALGPRGVAADMESLSGRSKNSAGNKSHRSHRSHRSHKSRSRRKKMSDSSVDSRGSRNSRNSRSSRYSHRSTKSYLSQMSEQSRSVANDLLRLEMQLAMVGSQDNGDHAAEPAGTRGGSVSGSIGNASRASRASRASNRRASSSSYTKRSRITVVAPPGKLGIILANKADSKGTVVSGVRTSSVLSEKISPGDRIVAIDGEDVSRMTVSEITTIMARKSDFERILTVLTTPKRLGIASPESYREPDGYYRR